MVILGWVGAFYDRGTPVSVWGGGGGIQSRRTPGGFARLSVLEVGPLFRLRPVLLPPAFRGGVVGGGVRIHSKNARMSGRHGAQYVAQCVAYVALTLVVSQ